MKTDYTTLHFKTNYLFCGVYLLAALYHFLEIFIFMNEDTWMRQALLVALNLFCAYGFVVRPRYFNIFFALFMAHQFYDNVHTLTSDWSGTQQIYWISLLALLILPLAMAKLLVDYFTFE